MSTIYLDNAATTQLSPSVLEEMMPYLTEQYGNPSSNHSLGIKARKAKEAARYKVASLINADPNEIFFTSGATESNNWILRAIKSEFEDLGYLMTSNIEHASIINTAEKLTKDRFLIVPSSGTGEVHPKGLSRRFEHTTKRILIVSIMAANNETGVINDISELARLTHERHTLFHTDATQLLGHKRINVKEMQVDALSASGHKIYGPKGIGFLYVNKSSHLYEILQRHPVVSGGHQEFEMRAGTENIPAIVGLGAACEKTKEFLDNKKNEENLRSLKKTMYSLLRKEIMASLNTENVDIGLPILSIRIPGVNNQELLQLLDEEGVCVSAGSACNENAHTPSHVLTVMGMKESEINETIRISIGRNNTEAEIKTASEIIIDKVKTLRMFDV